MLSLVLWFWQTVQSLSTLSVAHSGVAFHLAACASDQSCASPSTAGRQLSWSLILFTCPFASLTSLYLYFLLAYVSSFTQSIFFCLELTFVDFFFDCSTAMCWMCLVVRNGVLCQAPHKLAISYVVFISDILFGFVWRCCSTFLVIIFATSFETDCPEGIVLYYYILLKPGRSSFLPYCSLGKSGM